MVTQISIFDGANKYVNDKPIRLIECFAGYGSQALALKYLGIPFEHHRIAEWAVKSIQAYKDMHFPDDNTDYSCGLTSDNVIDYLFERGISADYNKPMTREQIKRMGENKCRTVYNNIKATHNLVSVCNVNEKDLEITDTDRFTYLLTYSFPCFTADSMVLTDNGYKKIPEISVGDMVLTHDNTYKKVTKTFDNGIHDVYSIKGMGVDEIKTTANHRFYVREMHRVGHKQIRCFNQPTWKQTKDLTKNDYLGIAINQNAIVPTWGGVKLSNGVKNELSKYMANGDFWWIIGRYLADGWQRTQGGIVICCGKSKSIELEQRLSSLFNYCRVEGRTAYKYHIAKKELQMFVDQFGKGAKNKKITRMIFDLPCDLLENFIDGYMSGDGCVCGGLYKATSISRELIYGMAQCVAKVYKRPYRIYKTVRNNTHIIEGRKVNQNDTYQLVYKKNNSKQDKAFYDDGYIWYPIKTIDKIEPQNVYDIEVEENHSFTVQNTIVHNCQDLSSAGLSKGMAKGSGTRSGLLWEIERILKECDELPQVLLMENVPEVIGKKNKDSFADWIAFLDSMGYKSKWEILNGTDFEIPQNRKRCFMVSVLGDYYYDFPKKLGCTLRLKDLLEKNVSEEYYLSDNILNYFVKHTKECEEKGNGFRFEPTDGDCIGKCVTTRAGGRMDDNFIYDKVHSVVKLPHGYFPGSIERNAEASPTIDTGVGKWHTLIGEETISQCECLGMLEGGKWDNSIESSRRVYSTEKAAPTVTTCGGGNQEIKIAIPANTKQGYEYAEEGDTINIAYPNSKTRRGRVGKQVAQTILTQNDQLLVEPLALDEQNGYIRQDGTIGTIVTDGSSPKHNNRVVEPMPNMRVRKLTTRECFRLMGVKDEDYERVAENQSKSSLYHCAGDSIVTSCLMSIFGELFDADWKNKIKLLLEEMKNESGL